jgi:hypothetical protein
MKAIKLLTLVIILKWRDLEPEPGVFKFKEEIGDKLVLADESA